MPSAEIVAESAFLTLQHTEAQSSFLNVKLQEAFLEYLQFFQTHKQATSI